MKYYFNSKKVVRTLCISYYADGLAAYERHLEGEKHEVGKQHMQKIESKHINLRTRIKRLVRRTICFSKTEDARYCD